MIQCFSRFSISSLEWFPLRLSKYPLIAWFTSSGITWKSKRSRKSSGKMNAEAVETVNRSIFVQGHGLNGPVPFFTISERFSAIESLDSVKAYRIILPFWDLPIFKIFIPKTYILIENAKTQLFFPMKKNCVVSDVFFFNTIQNCPNTFTLSRGSIVAFNLAKRNA